MTGSHCKDKNKIKKKKIKRKPKRINTGWVVWGIICRRVAGNLLSPWKVRRDLSLISELNPSSSFGISHHSC